MSGGVYVRIRYRCGKCGHQYAYDELPMRLAPTAAQIERGLRDDGWRRYQSFGWICPECCARVATSPADAHRPLLERQEKEQ